MPLKKLTYLLLGITLFCSCAASNKTIQHEVANGADPILKTYAIGDTAEGGIVFLVNREGTHGLVAALNDQFDNASYTECADMMNNPLYHDSEGAKYFDWRLPKVWEAYKMYMNLHMINQGSFSPSPYWTSQGPSSFEKMSLVNFSTGIEFSSLKTDTYRARAIRSF